MNIKFSCSESSQSFLHQLFSVIYMYINKYIDERNRNLKLWNIISEYNIFWGRWISGFVHYWPINILVTSCWVFLFVCLFVYLFIFFWSGWEGRGRERISSRFPAEHRAWSGAQSHHPEIMIWVEIRNRILNWLSHPGAPSLLVLFKTFKFWCTLLENEEYFREI